MPPPQCPECGRFLATAFVDRIRSEPADCPGCGTELSLADDEADDGDDAPAELGATTEPASEEAPDGETVPDEAGDVPVVPPPAATLPDDVEPEPETSVRPPDRDTERDPLAGWDETPTIAAPQEEPDPAVLAAGAGLGLVLGLLLGGREHRGLGALLGAALGAVVAYRQGER